AAWWHVKTKWPSLKSRSDRLFRKTGVTPAYCAVLRQRVRRSPKFPRLTGDFDRNECGASIEKGGVTPLFSKSRSDPLFPRRWKCKQKSGRRSFDRRPLVGWQNRTGN